MLPARKRLPHDVPLWVDPSKAHYFITISCKQRGQNQLARPAVAHRIFETVRYRNAQRIWYGQRAALSADVAAQRPYRYSEPHQALGSSFGVLYCLLQKFGYRDGVKIEHLCASELSFTDFIKAQHLSIKPFSCGIQAALSP